MTDLPEASALTLRQQVALLSGSDAWNTQPLPEAGVPSCALSDGPHGLRFQADAGDRLGVSGSEPSTCFPTAVTVASAWDEELAERIGHALAVEARAHGVDVVLGPGLNIKRHPLCGRNFEYFSEDPLLSGRLAAAMVNGLQRHGVGACLKHYAVNNQESHRYVVDAVVDERTLRELYLSGFEYAVKTSRPWTVMAAYNSVNGHPATQHRRLITGILREEWGFDGLVMSDWAATNDRVAAVAAGMDLEMPGSKGLFDREVLKAVASRRLPAELVTASAQRVLDLVARSARTRGPAIPVDEHDALARRAAAAGTVLLTNDGILPLAPGTRVALIGAFADQPRYQGSGSSLVNPTRISTARAEFARRGIEVAYAPGYDPNDSHADPDLIAEAVAAARSCDVAVVLAGLPPVYESEGFDRTDLGLPGQHDELVTAVCAANPRTVVALSNGAPVLMPWKDAPAAILESYLGGQAGGAALVDVLYGDAEPGGRLAETFPASLDDVAAEPYFPGEPRQVQYREGLYVGYRHDTTALFPFGHGLGYTTFDWSDVAAVRDTVTLTVTNTGTRAGSDVVQVYLHDRTGVVARPRRSLAGFAKVHLAAGQSTTVTIDVPERAYAFYDVVAREWRTPAGEFDLEIARSSADVVATVTVTVSDGVSTAAEPAGTPPIAVTDEQFRRRLGRPLPRPRSVRPFTRDSTLDEVATTQLGRLFKSALWRAAPIDEATRDNPVELAMYEHSLAELPLRAAAIFSGGKLRWRTIDLLLRLFNSFGRR
ncbi:glycoside hydrolase family 3 C-terminal domain-containing protein [Actinoplanes aureus]|uniref:Exo-alpha-(1->6)-L-arabinopyranosidase n=1 Tax=Actinoplanes aureus TaxID=2792083 RepID=A0A931C6K1_9ACTN|nr:glycoside hydrolase family 3 C-terminal domain-containing protein [Actinoplanes aureus]MBG0564350.1 glycoside hydrolase family 3 C-terminal domain-containing protein [Actinoplanes aureus]